MTAQFYDDLAGTYHALYPDWYSETVIQAVVLDRLIDPPDRSSAVVIDVACGIGTQLVGLAQLGYRMAASDLSVKAVLRARRECRQVGIDVAFAVADMRHLPWLDASADAVVCADNALPHLLADADVLDAFKEMRRLLRPGGKVIITTRDYDRVLQERPTVTMPQVFDLRGHRVISYQLWHWRGGSDIYDLEHFQTQYSGPGAWTTKVRTATYRAYTRRALADLAHTAGLTDVGGRTRSKAGSSNPCCPHERSRPI